MTDCVDNFGVESEKSGRVEMDEKGDGGEEGAVAWGWRGREAGLVPKGSGWVGWVGVWGGVGGGGGGVGVGVGVWVGVCGGSYWLMGEARCRSR